jgi:hypothetical protein
VRTTARSFQGLRFSIPQRHPSHAKCCSWERRTIDTEDATVRLQHCMKLYNMDHKIVQKQLKENQAKHIHHGADNIMPKHDDRLAILIDNILGLLESW